MLTCRKRPHLFNDIYHPGIVVGGDEIMNVGIFQTQQPIFAHLFRIFLCIRHNKRISDPLLPCVALLYKLLSNGPELTTRRALFSGRFELGKLLNCAVTVLLIIRPSTRTCCAFLLSPWPHTSLCRIHYLWNLLRLPVTLPRLASVAMVSRVNLKNDTSTLRAKGPFMIQNPPTDHLGRCHPLRSTSEPHSFPLLRWPISRSVLLFTTTPSSSPLGVRIG